MVIGFESFCKMACIGKAPTGSDCFYWQIGMQEFVGCLSQAVSQGKLAKTYAHCFFEYFSECISVHVAEVGGLFGCDIFVCAEDFIDSFIDS